MTAAVPVVGRGFSFEDLELGFRFRTHRRTLAEADLASFVNVTWLTEELFTVTESATDDSARAIKGRAVPGALVYSFAEGSCASPTRWSTSGAKSCSNTTRCAC